MVRARAAKALPVWRPFLTVLVAAGLLLPACAFAQDAAAPASDALLKLPRDLSPWGMFMAADIIVKAVMVGLAFASVLTWTIWFAKALELMRARARLNSAIEKLATARSWDEVTATIDGRNDSVGKPY